MAIEIKPGPDLYFGVANLMPVEIKPGSELDFAVANVIGLKDTCLGRDSGTDCVLVTSRDWDEMCGIEHFTTEGPIACKRFAPSTDLNAAFAAAEKVGLFSNWLLAKCEGFWSLVGPFERPMDDVNAPTPALAICAAILKLKETA